MTTPQDCSVGLGIESTYGTPVTVTRWLEFVSEGFGWTKNVVQGEGLRVGARVARSGRRVVPTASGTGDLELEFLSKGLGLLLQCGLGSGASTLVSAGLYQQVFTLADVPPSATIQKGLPRADGTVGAFTYAGCMVDELELSFAADEVLKVKSSWDTKDMTTATAYAAPSYPTAPQLLHFGAGTTGGLYTGTLTAPTTTALGSALTQVAGVRSGSVSLKRNLTTDRFNLGGSGRKDKPLTARRPEISGSLSVEYRDAVFTDAILADTSMTLLVTTTVGTDAVQIIVPEIKFDGALPTANGGDLIVQDLAFTGLDNLAAAQPFWVVVRTSDTAL